MWSAEHPTPGAIAHPRPPVASDRARTAKESGIKSAESAIYLQLAMMTPVKSLWSGRALVLQAPAAAALRRNCEVDV